MALLTITKEFHFHAAHKLELTSLSPEENDRLYGNCAKLHGHTYRLQVTVCGNLLDSGMLIDFGDLKRIVKESVLERYDHAFLNDLEEFRERPSTVENLVVSMYGTLSSRLKQEGLTITALRLYETPTSSATITADA